MASIKRYNPAALTEERTACHECAALADMRAERDSARVSEADWLDRCLCLTREATEERAALRSRYAEVEAERDEALRHLRAVLPICDERVRHIYQGLCPTDVEGTGNRDPECPACKLMVLAHAFLDAKEGE